MKRIISILLAAAVLFCAAGFAFAEEGHSGQCGESVFWSYDAGSGVLSVYGSGDMFNYYDDRDVPWYSFREEVTGIDIAPGVTSIGDNTFYCCNAAYVNVPDGVTYIGTYAFICCPFTEFYMPDSVTSTGFEVFSDCYQLERMRLSENLTMIDGFTFQNCYSLSQINIPDGVVSIGAYAFNNGRSLTGIELPDSLETLYYSAFTGCGLTSVVIPAGVTELYDGVFQFCNSLEMVEFLGAAPSFGERVFNECASGLTLYYHTSFEESWAPNGETSYCGYPICSIQDIPGDLDGDGTVSFNDVSRLYLLLLGDGAGSVCADFDSNGRVDFSDVSVMFLFLVGINAGA